jgi:hypothetical protein
MRNRVPVLCFIAGMLPVALAARAETPDAGAPPPTSITLRPIPNDAGAPPSGYAPDPVPALVTRRQWVIELGYQGGTVTFGGARKVEIAKATSTPRAMGRFAIELAVGKELVERVRFDFPLLGADELAGSVTRWDSPPNFSRYLSTRAAVMVPQSERATRATLVDRATGEMWPLPWPFDARPGAGGASSR